MCHWKGLTVLLFLSVLTGGRSLSAQAYQGLVASDVRLSFEVDTLDEINSPNSEFSPSLLGDELFFTSDREFDLLNWNMDSWRRRGYLSVYRVDIADMFRSDVYKHIERLPNDINIEGHTGPMVFSSDSSTAYLSRIAEEVEREDGGKERVPRLFKTKYEDDEWKWVVELDLVEGDASASHPSVMGNEEGLFFTSEQEEGEGTDIYFVEKVEEAWKDPEPIEAINSSDKEAFPYYRDSTLFFASDREGGLGGLDLYASVLGDDGEWSEPIHFDRPLNSQGDDFGIVLEDSVNTGFFSSNRIGGKGGDDIYRFRAIEELLEKGEGVFGRFEYRRLEGDVPEGKVVELLDEEGNVIMSTKTEEGGGFRFEELPPEEDVTLRLKDTDADVELALEGDREGLRLMKGKEGRFVYRKLEGERMGTQRLQELSDPTGEPTVPDISGQFVYERLPSKRAGQRTVQIVNEQGEVVMSRKTDENGNFQFDELPPNKDYRIRLKEVPDEDMTLHIYDHTGKVTAQLKSGEDGVFDYRKLTGDRAGKRSISMEDPDLERDSSQAVYGRFEYEELDKDVPRNMGIRVMNEEGEVQFASRADSAGFFRFVDVSLSDTMKFRVLTSDTLEGEMVIKIMNRYGEEIGVLHKNEEGYFMYRELEADRSAQALSKKARDEAELSLPEKKEAEDTGENGDEMEERTPLTEKDTSFMVHFDRNSSHLKESEKTYIRNSLDLLMEGGDRIRIRGHASARGTPEYNEWLSGKRAERIRDFLVNEGIDAERLRIESFGEEDPLNDCRKAQDCGDEGHAENRRVELIPYQP